MISIVSTKYERIGFALILAAIVQISSVAVKPALAVEQVIPSLAEDVSGQPVPEAAAASPNSVAPSESVPACPSQPPIQESRNADFNGCAVGTGGMVCVANPDRSATASDLFHYWGRATYCPDRGCAQGGKPGMVGRGANAIRRFADEMRLSGAENSNACYICGCYRGQGCFAPGTRVTQADGSEKLVDDLRVGDQLWNPVENIAYTVKQVVEGAEPVPLVELIAGATSMTVSQEHIVYTPDGFKRAKELVAGDLILRPDGSPTALDSARLMPVTDGQYVINVILEGPDAGAYGHLIQSEGFVSGDLYLQNNLETLLAAERN